MKNFSLVLILCAIASIHLAISPAVSASDLPPVEELMSGEEMDLTGVSRLTDKERQALSDWLEVFVTRDADFVVKEHRKRQKEALKAARRAEKDRRKSDPAPDQEIADERDAPNPFAKADAHIVGAFSGWRGKTRFTLDNGEVWEQRRPDSMRKTKTLQNPEVRIKRNVMGFYVMEVPAAGVKVPVTRVK